MLPLSDRDRSRFIKKRCIAPFFWNWRLVHENIDLYSSLTTTHEILNMKRRLLSATLCAALALVSCSGPRMVVYDHPVTATKTSRAFSNSTALEFKTREILRQEDLLNLYRIDAGKAVQTLAARYKQQPSDGRRRALAEICADQGDRLTSKQPVMAIGHYLDTAQLTEKAALVAVGQQDESVDRTLYDYSAARVARLIRNNEGGSLTSITAPGVLHNWRISLDKGNGAVDPRTYDILVPATWLKAKGLKWKDITQDGFGAAMVGYREATPERLKQDPMMPECGRGFPLNASFRLSGNSATLVLQDLMTSSNARVAGRSLPLSGNFSAALAFVYYSENGDMKRLPALLRPGDHVEATKMYSLEPFREHKIPLILVHGLISTAEFWLPFVNLLLADPVVREKYQIVLFNYPSGNPITRNAADLREALAKFQTINDPGRSNPRMRNMVILGHSMGGVISNMQIRDSGDRLYKSVFRKNLNELDLSASQKNEIRRVAFFKANPDINRAILLAAPLRGSEIASNQLGKFGAWLIRLPFESSDTILGDLAAAGVLTDAGERWGKRPNNSINGLRPDNPTLERVLDSPVRRGVTIHSIIAKKNPVHSLLESSDGVVPYTSAHLDKAVSEEIVEKAAHTRMVIRDETIEEVLRILYLQAGVKPSR